MGGNAKYKNARMRTATVGNSENDRKAVTDSIGNVIRVAEGRQVGKGKRTNTTASNARERMQNAKAIQEVRNMAKQVRYFNRNYTKMNNAEIRKNFVTARSNLLELSKLAKQVDSNINLDTAGLATSKEIENALGVKLT